MLSFGGVATSITVSTSLLFSSVAPLSLTFPVSVMFPLAAQRLPLASGSRNYMAAVHRSSLLLYLPNLAWRVLTCTCRGQEGDQPIMGGPHNFFIALRPSCPDLVQSAER